MLKLHPFTHMFTLDRMSVPVAGDAVRTVVSSSSAQIGLAQIVECEAPAVIAEIKHYLALSVALRDWQRFRAYSYRLMRVLNRMALPAHLPSSDRLDLINILWNGFVVSSGIQVKRASIPDGKRKGPVISVSWIHSPFNELQSQSSAVSLINDLLPVRV
jgi:hypothetical protein